MVDGSAVPARVAYSALADACGRSWRVWRRSHRRMLRRSCRRLAATADPRRLLREWLAINEFCDAVQDRFVARCSREVLHEWYARAGHWCQGSANLVHALLVGVDAWQQARDFFNTRTRQFRSDPAAEAAGTVDKLLYLLRLLRDPPRRPLAVYVELDCWNKEEDLDEEELPHHADAAPAASATPAAEAFPAAEAPPDAEAPSLGLTKPAFPLAAPSVSPEGRSHEAQAAWAGAPPWAGEHATGSSHARAHGTADCAGLPLPTTQQVGVAYTQGGVSPPAFPATQQAGGGFEALSGAGPAAPDGTGGNAARENARRIAALEQQLAAARAAIALAAAAATGDKSVGKSARTSAARSVGEAEVKRKLRAASGKAAYGESLVPPPEGVFFSGQLGEEGAPQADQQPNPANSQQQNLSAGPPAGDAFAFRPYGGHVFVVQVEGETETSGAGCPETGCGGCPPPASAYTIYSSWTGEYTLQEWMQSRPELAHMRDGALEVWMRELGLLLHTPVWSGVALARVAQLFGVSHNTHANGDARKHAATDATGPVSAAAAGAAAAARVPAVATAATAAADAATAALGQSASATGEGGTAHGTAAHHNTHEGSEGRSSVYRGEDRSGLALGGGASGVSREGRRSDVCRGGEEEQLWRNTARGLSSGSEEAEGQAWRSPAKGWRVAVDQPVLWELHVWAQGYDDMQTEEHARVIEQLHVRATQVRLAQPHPPGCTRTPVLHAGAACTTHAPHCPPEVSACTLTPSPRGIASGRCPHAPPPV